MLTPQALAFAEIGKLAQSTAQHPIATKDTLDKVRSLLTQNVGRLERVFDLTFNTQSETFKGKAEQRISLSRSQTYEFTIALGKISYKLVESPTQFSDEDWSDLVDFVASIGEKLACRPGNVQCGGHCQNGDFKCDQDPTPAQKRSISSLIASAKEEVRSVVATGRGREVDIKPALEAGVVATVGAIAPKGVAPLAAGAAQLGMRTWRLSYEEVNKSGIQGLFEGFKKISPEDRQKMYSDAMTKVVASAAGKLGGALAADHLPDVFVPLTELNVSGTAAGTGAGISTAKAVSSTTRSIARKLVKD
jgi:hypothetical protein